VLEAKRTSKWREPMSSRDRISSSGTPNGAYIAVASSRRVPSASLERRPPETRISTSDHCRSRRIEELLGHPIAARRFELEAAVRLARALGLSGVEAQAPQVSDAIASILFGANRTPRALSSA